MVNGSLQDPRRHAEDNQPEARMILECELEVAGRESGVDHRPVARSEREEKGGGLIRADQDGHAPVGGVAFDGRHRAGQAPFQVGAGARTGLSHQTALGHLSQLAQTGDIQSRHGRARPGGHEERDRRKRVRGLQGSQARPIQVGRGRRHLDAQVDVRIGAGPMLVPDMRFHVGADREDQGADRAVIGGNGRS